MFPSCKKDTFSKECNQNNKPPIATAGPDQVITLPTDILLLDGSASSDPDGKISAWQWTKISGPASFIINNSLSAKTTVKNLKAGTYQFELKITDVLPQKITGASIISVNNTMVAGVKANGTSNQVYKLEF